MDSFVESYNTLITNEIETLKVDRKRYSSDGSYKSFCDENDRNIKRIEALLDMMYRIKKDAQITDQEANTESDSTSITKQTLLCL